MLINLILRLRVSSVLALGSKSSTVTDTKKTSKQNQSITIHKSPRKLLKNLIANLTITQTAYATKSNILITKNNEDLHSSSSTETIPMKDKVLVSDSNKFKSYIDSKTSSHLKYQNSLKNLTKYKKDK